MNSRGEKVRNINKTLAIPINFTQLNSNKNLGRRYFDHLPDFFSV